MKKVLKKSKVLLFIYSQIKFMLIVLIVFFNRKIQKNRKRSIGDSNFSFKVAFFVQNITSWNKMQCTYLRMIKDKRFDPIIICIPESGKKELRVNKVYEYFLSNKYYNAINAVDGNRWITLKRLDLDFIFYDRPYDNYLPYPFKSYNACKYAKVCLILYATQLTENLLKSTLNKFFMISVSYYFAETEDVASFSNKENSFFDQRTIVCGIPALESVFQGSLKEYRFLGSHKLFHKVIWTPRWSMDTNGGGSNFLSYYQPLLKYFEMRSKYSVVIRPHPLMFSNIVKNKYLSEAEVKNFKESCARIHGIELDESNDYIETFSTSDVLISDFSSIIVEYFVTGKPIIYCRSDQVNWRYLPFFQEIINCCYIVNTFEELIYHLELLEKGIDPLKEERIDVIKKLVNLNKFPSEIIIDALSIDLK